MRGPIDYIIVGFEGNNFNGSILKALADASDNGTIAVLDLALIAKDENGVVTELDVTKIGDDYAVEFVTKYTKDASHISSEDVEEMADLLENNTAAGMVVIEQLWAKPLKQAIINANGVLVAEGRIHPDASAELES